MTDEQNKSSNQYVWIPAERIGQIEVREYVHGDQARHAISISEADMNLPTLVGGFVARNPDNHDDQWYIAREYFNKHYRIPVEQRLPVETKSLHVTECNYQRGPIGGEGCVCVVVNKHTLPPAPPRQVADCKHERARLLCEDCGIDFRNIPQRHPTEDSPVETECDREDPKARIGSPEHTQAEAIRTLKASALPQKYHTTPGTIDGPCIHCKQPFAVHWRDDETYAYMCPVNGSGE